MTQCEKILQYMEHNGSITQAEAVDHFHCYRLGCPNLRFEGSGHPQDRKSVV